MVFKRMGGGLGFAPEPAVDQVGSAADVVDVGVGQQQVVDLVGRDGPLAHGLLGFVPLGQAAVDEDGEFVELKQLAGAGDAVFGAEMGNTIVSHRQTQMNTDKMNIYHEGYEEHEENTTKDFYREGHEKQDICNPSTYLLYIVGLVALLGLWGFKILI
jgi:hypothetical protein